MTSTPENPQTLAITLIRPPLVTRHSVLRKRRALYLVRRGDAGR